MEYVALYRRWRPNGFQDLIGQDAISTTLTRAIEEDKIAHAYLFSGPRGTGKTSSAKIFAMGINCVPKKTANPCGTCASCQSIKDGSSMDVYEIDAASNRGIEEIRDLRASVNFTPVNSRYKVYIIDEVHMLTTEAFNALLKTLEEPPKSVVFILATTEIHKVPLTIQSRCQRYDFKRISSEDIIKRLQFIRDNSHLKITDKALHIIARQADGGMRDALSLLDQCLALSLGDLTDEEVIDLLGLVKEEKVLAVLVAISDNKPQVILDTLDEIIDSGYDITQLVIEMIRLLRNAMLYQDIGALKDSNFKKETLAKVSEKFQKNEFIPIIRRLNELLGEMKWSLEQKISVETAFLEIAHTKMQSISPTPASENNALDLARLARLEEEIAKLSLKIAKNKTSSAREGRACVEDVLPHARREEKESQPLNAGAKMHKTKIPAQKEETPLLSEAKARETWQKLFQKTEVDLPSIHASLKSVYFVTLEKNVFRLSTQSPFVHKCLTGDEYKSTLEKILLEITGSEYKIHCTFSGVEKKPPKKVSTKKENLITSSIGDDINERRVLLPYKAEDLKPVEVDLQNLPSDERSNLEEAMSVFGNTFVTPPEKD